MHKTCFCAFYKNNMSYEKDCGKFGEDTATNYFSDNGYNILKRNYSKKYYGEIDVIIEKDNKLRFIEVKTRISDTMILPICTVNKQKQKRIIKTSKYFLYEFSELYNLAFKEIYFDIFEVIIKRGLPFEVLSLKHHKDAFSLLNFPQGTFD